MSPTSTPFARNKDNLIVLDRLARHYNTRPSAIMNISPGDMLAYQLDVAAMLAGRERDEEQLEETRQSGGIKSGRNTSNKQLTTKNMPKDEKAFANPMGLHGARIRKMKIPESGIW